MPPLSARSHGTITRALLIGTVVVGSFGAATLDRAVVATPAWNQIGAAAWATYSRHADLGNGLIVYPIYGIGLVLLAIAAAISYRLDPDAPRAAGLPVYLAALGALGVVVTTIKAAPFMLSLNQLDANDPTALQNAFEQFTFWGLYIRGALGALALLASIWALAEHPRTLRPTPATIPPTA
ncbi:hypothetical protein [Flindersiella endophytica]